MTNNTSTFIPSTQIIDDLELDPRFFIGGGPAPIDIEPGDPIFQEIAELLRASKPEADGLTGTGPTMPAYDEDERMKPSDALKESAAIVGAAGGIAAATGVGAPAAAGIAAYSGVLYISGTIMGAFGLDVDESEPYIPEVGVDALA